MWLHRLSEIDSEARTALCAECGPVKINRRGYTSGGKVKWRCRESVNREWQRAYDLQRPNFGRHVPNYTAGDYAARLDQQSGGCAICKTPPTDQRLAIDHDHSTGDVRGLLCRHCNLGLGNFRDNSTLLDAAKAYLAQSK